MKESGEQKKSVERQKLMDKSVSLNTDTITPAMLLSLQAGDQSAFEAIYLKYSHKITKFIFSMIKSFDDAEEISQEVFTHLWTNRHKIDVEKDISSYLYILARFNILKYFRSKRVHEAYLKDAMHVNVAETIGSDELMYAEEIKLIIDLTVEKMPAQRKKIYRMSRIDGISNEEIAGQLGITKNTVEKHITFALKDIREIVMLFILIFIQ